MDSLRFLYCFLSDRSEPDWSASELRQLEFSLRPGMHQPIEDPNESSLTPRDREFLSQMGICTEIDGAENGLVSQFRHRW
jgi:hypothetical protein